MRHRWVSKIIFPLAIATLVAPFTLGRAAAKAKPFPSTPDLPVVTEVVTFPHRVNVNGTMVPPGTYHLVAKWGNLMVEDSNRNVYAKAPIFWQIENHGIAQTKLDIHNGKLDKVELGNTDEAVRLYRPSPPLAS
jgi:hypothetical protein